MKYSQFLSDLVRSQGQPNFSEHQFRIVMNIVSLESKRATFKKANEIAEKTGEPRKFDVNLFQVDVQLTKITGNLEPQLFFEKLLSSDSTFVNLRDV